MPYELMRRAFELECQGDLDAAISLLTRGIDSLDLSERHQELSVLTNTLSILCERTGRHELGIEYLRRCLGTYPDDLASWHHLAQLLMKIGRVQDARTAVDKLRRACNSSTHRFQREWQELLERLEQSVG